MRSGTAYASLETTYVSLGATIGVGVRARAKYGPVLAAPWTALGGFAPNLLSLKNLCLS